MSKMVKLKTSLFGRSAGILKAATALVVSEAKDRLLTRDVDKILLEKIAMAQNLTKSLSELKGAAMKFGQLLSLEMQDILPKEAMDVIQKLQKDASPVDFDQIEKQVKSELKEKFTEIELKNTPLAVASIGQVHEALYKKEWILLKIQYPEIEKTIPSDLKMLKILMKQWSFLMRKEVNLDLFFEEFENTLMQETDYIKEAQSLIKAKELFLNDDRFLVPVVVQELSTRRVIAMNKLPGIPFSSWLKTNPSREDRQNIGSSLMELFLKEFFVLGFVQTDPNPGNFLITEDLKVALLDYGAAKSYEKDFIEDYKKILRAAFDRNFEHLFKLSSEFGLIDSREPDHVKKVFFEMMDKLISPFRMNQDFRFSDKNYDQEARKLAMELTKICVYSPPPEKIIFLHRKLGGVFYLLKHLDVELNLHSYWKTYVI